MGERMQFGVWDQGDSSGVPAAQHLEHRLRFVQALDQSGFYAYHLGAHHASPLGSVPSQTAFLAGAAQRTTRLRLGTLVYLGALHHPVRLSDEICTLDQLSNGRFLLGMGRGGAPVEHGYFGHDRPTGDAMAREALEVVLAGLTSDVLDFEGRFYKS